ncbi:MAG: CHRD domain-containing protein [Burkholderiales bacterium]
MNNSIWFIKRLVFFAVLILSAFAASCGGSSYSGGSTPPPPTTNNFNATLFGAQETLNIATPAVGFGSVRLIEDSYNNTNTLSGSVTTMGITGTNAHIDGPVIGGVNAPPVITLTESPAGSGVWVVPDGTIPTPAQIVSLKAGEMYSNVHSTANSGGEIRGQIGRDVRNAVLAGPEEVPTNASTATGKGVVIIDPATKSMSASVTTTDMGINGTVAHIHEAVVGVSGPPVIELLQTSAGSGIWTATATLTDAQYTALKSGRYYFNVHSNAFQNGEIRGQIGPVFGKTSLTGAQEFPSNTSTATGTGIIVVNPVTLAVSAGLKTSRIVGGNVAHIHGPAAAGNNVPAIVPLTQSAADSGNWSAAAGALLSPAQFTSLLDGLLYFNSHSLPTYSGGEIRGQISLK